MCRVARIGPGELYAKDWRDLLQRIRFKVTCLFALDRTMADPRS